LEEKFLFPGQVEQAQLKQRLERTRNAPVDIGSERTPMAADSDMETLSNYPVVLFPSQLE